MGMLDACRVGKHGSDGLDGSDGLPRRKYGPSLCTQATLWKLGKADRPFPEGFPSRW